MFRAYLPQLFICSLAAGRTGTETSKTCQVAKPTRSDYHMHFMVTLTFKAKLNEISRSIMLKAEDTRLSSLPSGVESKRDRHSLLLAE